MDFTILADQFLDTYGLAAIFGIMMLKELGIPIPIPGDLIMLGAAARAAQGKFPFAAVFFAILIPMLVGGTVQYWVAKGPGRQFIYRVGKIIGLTKERLDRAMDTVRKGGMAAVALGLNTPGVRIATIPAAGLAELAPSVFLPGLVIGSATFLGWHFAIGYAGGAALAILNASPVAVAAILLAVIAIGVAGWLVVRRMRSSRAVDRDALPGTFTSWADASCPACIAITLIRERQSPQGGDVQGGVR
jgi:membrane protein DedA with SNARE-associated domain